MGGGSKSTEVKIPEWLEAAGQEALARSREVSRIPYAPYYGPDVAAMTPMQVAAMRGTNQMAEAFGSPTADVTAGMPTAQDYGGMSAYSAGPMYDAALAELQRRQPGTYNAIMAQFGSTATGAMPAGASAAAGTLAQTNRPNFGGGGDYGGYGSGVSDPSPSGPGTLGLPAPMSGKITSIGPIGMPGGGGMGRGKG